jgi:hypothetical protein
MTAADESEGTPAHVWTVEEIMKHFPADPDLMSSPEGDKRGLARLQRRARERIAAIAAEQDGRGTA